jgi:hypothetical protein
MIKFLSVRAASVERFLIPAFLPELRLDQLSFVLILPVMAFTAV